MAILLDEPEKTLFASKIHASTKRLISVASVLEVTIAATNRGGEALERHADLLLRFLELEPIPVDQQQLSIAREAFLLFGKGRHPAGLNFGDCFSFALAKAAGEPLLFKGTDFALTGIAAAV